MKKGTIAAFTLIVVMVLSFTACGKRSDDISTTTQSDTTPAATGEVNTTCMLNEWHNVFSGTIGTDEIYMNIYQDGNNLTAFYVNEDNENAIKLVGNLDGFDITLKDDTQNTLTGTVTSADKPGGHIQGTLAQNNGSTLPVVLEFDYACGDSLDNFYEIMGSNNQEVETFVSELKNNVISTNKQAVAQLIYYPINVSVGDKDISINSSQEFLDNYDKIMNRDFVNAISNSRTKLLFHNSQGAMFGGDFYNIWIQKTGDGLEVIGINN